MDYQSLNNESQSKPKTLNKKGIIIAGISLVIIAILIITITVSLKNSTPSKEQLQEDLIQQELDDENLSISDFTIYSENKSDNKYTAVASVTYEKENVEYNEKYLLSYSKYDEWQFCDVEDYDKNLWTKKPTVQPNTEEYTKLCLEKLEKEHHCSNYNSFVFNESKSSCDLESGKATYAFDVKRETAIESRTGEIDFSIEFDFDKGKWNIKKITYADSYKIAYNFLHSWSGTLKCEVDSAWADTDDKKAKFSITDFKKGEVNGTIKGQFILDNKTYDMSGTISLPESYDGITKYDNYNYVIDMTGTNEKVCRIDGTLRPDGSLYMSINTDYTGDGEGFYIYYEYNIFSGEMTIL